MTEEKEKRNYNDSTVCNDSDYIDKERATGQRRRGSPVYDEERHVDSRRGNSSRENSRYYDDDLHRDRRRRRSRSPRYRRRRSRERYYRRDSSRYYSRSPERSEDDHRESYRRGRERGYHVKHANAKMAAVEDPFAALRSAAIAPADPAEMARKMQEQQLQARQLVLQQQAASAVKAASRTQREVYIGNITPGAVTEKMIHELFRATLTAAFPSKCQNGAIDPVTRIAMVEGQKYCFMEVSDAEMATACLDLSGKVQLMGAVLTIGRPAGYVDPKQANRAALTAANALAIFQADGQKEELETGKVTIEELEQRPSAFICIDGVIDDTLPEEEYGEIIEDLKSELERHGTVLRIHIADSSSYQGKALVQFLDAESASKARAVIDGRLFDGRTLCATSMLAKDYVQVATNEQKAPDTAGDTNPTKTDEDH